MQTSNRLKSERGIAVPMAALAMMALIGMTTVGIETGRLATTATEVQDAADIAALTGARAMIDGGEVKPVALHVLMKNTINGEKVNGANIQSLDIGYYDTSTGFIANMPPTNAVRAVITYKVKNLLASALGMPVSIVTKSAVAMFQGVSGCTPTLPIVIGECLFTSGCTEDSCMPLLRMAPNPIDNSAWTGYFGGTSTSTVGSYMPQQCGGSTAAPFVKMGDYVNVTNGDLSSSFKDVQCMIDHDLDEVTVLVVPCGTTYNQAMRVSGCATFDILSVKRSGSPKGITMQGLLKVVQALPGGTNFGSGTIALVN